MRSVPSAKLKHQSRLVGCCCAGGPKQTGGGRTNGKQGLEEYLISKTVSINLNN